MLKDLYKLAYDLDRKGQYDMAQEIEKVMESLAKRVGIDPKDMVSLADYFDSIGDAALANHIDSLLEKVAKAKGKEKPSDGATRKAPKGWFDKMKKDIKKKNPEYNNKKIKEVVDQIWNDDLSDAKREQICKRYKKTKNPNK